MCHDFVNGDEELGHVFIGSMGARGGYRQWKEAIRSPEVDITAWHRLTTRW